MSDEVIDGIEILAMKCNTLMEISINNWLDPSDDDDNVYVATS
jgi:hypothetical protein